MLTYCSPLLPVGKIYYSELCSLEPTKTTRIGMAGSPAISPSWPAQSLAGLRQQQAAAQNCCWLADGPRFPALARRQPMTVRRRAWSRFPRGQPAASSRSAISMYSRCMLRRPVRMAWMAASSPPAIPSVWCLLVCARPSAVVPPL